MLRGTIHYLLLCFVGLLLLIWDPIGLQDRIDSYSQDLFNLILLGESYPSKAQDKLTVLLMREADLEQLRTTWPPPYHIHAEVLRNLWGYEPEAIFVDMLFSDQRSDSSITELQDAICRLQKEGINIYLASGAPGEEHGGVRPELDGCADIVAVPKLREASDNVMRRYPLWHSAEDKTFPTAAFALYQEYAGTVDPADFSQPMELIWGVRPHPLNRKWMSCEPEPAGPKTTALRVLSQGVESAKINCPYSATLTVKDLFTRASDRDVERLVEGRIILYGAYIQGASDIVHAPTHTAQAGVYMHAMALDNLITWGEGYIRSLDQGRLNRALIIDLGLVMLVAALYLVYRRQQMSLAEMQQGVRGDAGDSAAITGYWRELWIRLSRAGLFVISLVVVGSVVVMASYVAYQVMSLAPRNWLGYMGFIFILNIFSGFQGGYNVLLEFFHLLRRCFGYGTCRQDEGSTLTTTKGEES